MDIVKKLRILLDRKQKISMVGLVILMVFGAVLETCSIGFLIPVLSAILDIDSLMNYKIVKDVYDAFHMKSTTDFIVMMMAVLIVLFVVKNIFLQVQHVIQYRFVFRNQYTMAKKMMVHYMKRPYEFYLNADTAVVQRNITSDIINMYALILCVLQLMSEVLIFFFLVAATMILQPVMTLVLMGVLLFCLLLIKLLFKPIMSKSGKENRENYSGLLKWIQQAVVGIKEIKIGNREEYFVDEYVECNGRYINALKKYSIYKNIPRLLIESVCVAGMLGYLIVMLKSGKSIQNMVPMLGAFGLAVIRLMPSANRISNYLTDIAYFKPFLMGISDSLRTDLENTGRELDILERMPEKLDIKDKVTLEDITYAYPNTDVLIFDKAHMEIPIGDAVGIVGTSGAGKSTIVDILLGLLQLKGGKILADGKDVLDRENYRQWLNNVGYIPQQIFMLDSTIRKNVAFGVPEEEIDEDRIWEVLKEAQLDEFVRGLPKGLDTGIGERGIRLSGGQRQRIGIARALYDDPEILILDDSASALDFATDAKLRKAIRQMDSHPVVFIVSQRASSIQYADQILVLEDGEMAGLGTHAELMESCEIYREIYESQFETKKNQNAAGAESEKGVMDHGTDK